MEIALFALQAVWLLLETHGQIVRLAILPALLVPPQMLQPV
jgi:hypothetical protein